MEVITDRDVLRLSNALSVKCDLNIKLTNMAEVSSDYLLIVYNAIMGELPIGILTDSISVRAQEHNVTCIVDTLANDYLHVDLSHISAQYFVAGDPTTIYNLIEILDGLFEFMLDQISNGIDSGDEGDIESDVMSDRPKQSKRIALHQSFDSTRTEDLLASNDKASEGQLTDVDDSHFVPLLSDSAEAEAQHLKSACSISEYTLDSADLDSTLKDTGADNTESLLKLQEPSDKEKGPVEKALKSTYKVFQPETKRETTSGEDSSDSKSPTEEDLQVSHEVPPLPEPSVTLDGSERGPALSVSDVTSEEALSSIPPSVVLEDRNTDRAKFSDGEKGSTLSSGVDEPDGIPKPDMQEQDGGYDSFARTYPPLRERQRETPIDVRPRDWNAMLDNLQKTVEESRKIREKYFATPRSGKSSVESEGSRSETASSINSVEDFTRPKSLQRNVRFEDTISTRTARDLQKFKEVLQKEKDLQRLKNKILSSSYQDHLEEVEEAERLKIKPAAQKARKTQREFQSAMNKPRQARTTKKSSTKKDLAAAAKWKSWQSPIVRKTPTSRRISPRRKIRGNLEIGEHDLLPLLISEFPGLQLSSTTLNNAWKKQFRQIENLTARETAQQKSKKHQENKLQDAHRRHHLLTDIMRKEHEHTQRVRESKMRDVGRRETERKVKERRQQSARVRRYYRDYQIQMRSRMLKRRTREERLFQNLFEEGLDIQRSRLRELRKYARDKRQEQEKRQRDEIASLENYYKDQFAILSETLENEKSDLRCRDKAQTELLRKMKCGLREKMEREIGELQERIARDDEDIYFRELEADRIRRQLQLATYHTKFDHSIAKSL